jgi:hypothetical protein
MKWFAWFLCLSVLVVSNAQAFADEKSPPTQITMVFTGHNAELFGIHTVAPIVNPANCPHDPDSDRPPRGYATDSSQPGYHTFYAAALLAFAERADVEVVVDDEGCVAGRPRLIGINILR